MNKHNYFKTLMLLIISALTFVLGSCNDDDNEEYTACGDAVFIKRKIKGQVKTCTNYYAYCSYGIGSTKVTTPSNNIFELEKYNDSGTTFWYESADSVYVEGAPKEGTGSYFFTIISESGGDSIVIEDQQEFDDIALAEIDSLYYSESTGHYVGWDSISGADSYRVYLLNSDNNIVFAGDELTPSNSEINLLYDTTSGTWIEKPESGKSYIIRIYGRVYDSDATSKNYIYNIQEISIRDTIITWGE